MCPFPGLHHQLTTWHTTFWLLPITDQAFAHHTVLHGANGIVQGASILTVWLKMTKLKYYEKKSCQKLANPKQPCCSPVFHLCILSGCNQEVLALCPPVRHGLAIASTKVSTEGNPCSACTLHTSFGQKHLLIAPVPNTHKTSPSKSPHYKTKSKCSNWSQSQGTSMKKPMYARTCCGSCSCAVLTPTFLAALHPNIHGWCRNMQDTEVNSL